MSCCRITGNRRQARRNRRTLTDKARELLEENRGKLKYSRALTSANKVLADLRKAKQKVLRDPEMTPKVKTRMIDGINAKINRISGQVAQMTEGAF